MTCSSATLWAALLVAAIPAMPLRATAQDVPPEVKLTPVTEEAELNLPSVDLQNIVTSATKSVSSVQETPAIVTIITGEDIRQWGYRTLEDVLSDLPGWFRYGTAGLTIPSVTVRGMVQAMLVLRDGVPTLDPFANLQVLNRSLPLESIKRIEAVTGPGGVLWGANSFLGVVNIITKDAEDVSGAETGAGYGDGRGNRSDVRAYAMLGTTLLGGRVKAFLHASYENYVGQELTVRQFIAGAIPPQPSGDALFGPIETSDSPRSWVYNVDGKISAGPLSLYWLWADGMLRWGGTFPIGAVPAPPLPNDPTAGFDPRGTARDNVVNRFDRVVALEYRDRGVIGIDAKAYLTESFFEFGPLLFFPASSLVQGGVVGETVARPYRLGMTLDSDFILGAGNRVLWGGEAFTEWSDTSTLRFLSPDPSMPRVVNRLPFLCPHDAMGYTPQCPVTFAFAASREVAAGFVSDQWHPVPSLLLDGGVRVQAGFGQRAYDALALFSGSLVWNFLPGFHLKGNFSQGFRPPVFNNTDSNGTAAEYGGNRSMKNEFSTAYQGEVNARVLRGVGRVRDLTVRADYSYSILDNAIIVNGGQYFNSGRRGISSAEFLGRLTLRGEHKLQMGYTYLQASDSVKGLVRAIPNDWFTINASFSVVPGHFELISTLFLSGAAEDPNRIPSVNTAMCLPGSTIGPGACGGEALTSNLSFDRIPAVAVWNLGARLTRLFDNSLEIDAFVYNVLDQRWFQPDSYYDFNPLVETQSFPGTGFSFFAQARVRY